MAVTVRRLAEAQWREYAELRLRALADAPSGDPSDGGGLYRREALHTAAHWRRRLREDAQFALYDDALGARAVGLVAAHPRAPDGVFLYSLWLDPAARGHGASRMLLAAALGWAREQRAARVALRVDADNEVARAVYEEFGFAGVAPALSGEPAPGPAVVTMALTLTPPDGTGP